MKTVDVSGIFVMYNLVIGVLIMLSSEKVAAYAGYINNTYRERIVRLTRVTFFTFGSCVAAVAGFIYIVWYVLKLGI